MGSSVSARDLINSLGKALDMGVTEEPFEILGHSLVVRNLRPTEVEAVLASCKGLEDLTYLNVYQGEHVARGLVEFDGVDLRAVDFIDDEEPDPKKPGSTRKVRVERHKWLMDKILSSWGPDAIHLTYLKIGDCTLKASTAAREGIQFAQAEESVEERIRRLLGEAVELEDDLPSTLFAKILDDYGLIRKSTLAEMKHAEEILDKVRREEEAAAQPEPTKEASPPEPEPEPGVVSAASIMANRKPLHQQVPVPPPERIVPKAPLPAPAQTHQPTPTHQAPKQTSVSSRAAELAALEGDADVAGVLADHTLHGVPVVRSEAVELRPMALLTEQQANEQLSGILDSHPSSLGGVNPKFRPPSKI
jgi:hypothetical protein